MFAAVCGSSRKSGDCANRYVVFTGCCLEFTCTMIQSKLASGELIVSKYVAESITMIAGRFGHEGLCQLRTELKKLQCEIGYIANTGQWCCVMLSGCINNQ